MRLYARKSCSLIKAGLFAGNLLIPGSKGVEGEGEILASYKIKG